MNNIIINQKLRRSLQDLGGQQSQPSYWKYSPETTKSNFTYEKTAPFR